MFAYTVVAISLAVLLAMTNAHENQPIPNVIIGDPNDPSSDTIGPLISDAEFEAALANDDLLTYQSEDRLPLETQDSYFQGDIQLKTKDQLIEIMLNKETDGQNSAISNPSLKWPKAQIPYYISNSFSSTERAVIARAMGAYHSNTCIRFVPRSTQGDYIHILRGGGCSSMVGRVGGAQSVSLGHGCVRYGTVIHELMHAAGFWHEQSRYDRDSYVTINWSNIWPGMAFNFNTKSRSVTQSFGLKYDYASVMHYPKYAFARNPRIPTIYPRIDHPLNGQQIGFSQTDIKGLNLLYQCSGIIPPKPSGCVDTNKYCSDWATKGQCQANPAYMNDYCKKSCGKCDTSACVDKNRHCASWAKGGQCSSNAEYMKPNCPKSCDACDDTVTTNCVDENAFCPDWALKGQCNSNPEYMHESCKMSCNKCSSAPEPINCEDENEFCSDWASQGQCESNSGFMQVKCKKSCDRCNIPKPTGNCLDDNEFCSDWASKGHCESNAAFMKVSCKRSCQEC